MTLLRPCNANTELSTLKNTISLFHVLEKELEWRKSVGRPEGYEAMRKSKPLIAVGPVHPLEEEELMLDYFRKAASFWDASKVLIF